MEKVYIVKEIEISNFDGMRIHDLSSDINVSVFSNKEDAKSFLKERYDDRVYEESERNYLLNDEDEVDEEKWENDGYIEKDFIEEKGYISEWNCDGEGIMWLFVLEEREIR